MLSVNIRFLLAPFIFLLTLTTAPLLAKNDLSSVSNSSRARDVLDFVKTHQTRKAVDQLDPSLADEVRDMDTASRRTFAYLFNEKGVQLANEQKIPESLSCLELAVEFYPERKVYHKNFSQILIGSGQERYLSGDFKGAEEDLSRALEHDPENAGAMIALSDVYYYSQKIKEAKGILEEAERVEPDSEEIRKRLERISGDETLEKGMKVTETEIFDIKFHKDQNYSYYNIYDLKQTLRKAYRQVGQNLRYFPRHPIAVILYPEEDYRKLRQVPEWSSGAYDGKIRIPIPSGDGIKNERLKQIIWHEYTHALIRDITAGSCPIWLNEGLAEYHGYLFSRFDITTVRNAYLGGELLTLKELSQEFQAFSDPDRIRLAYAQSYLLVNFIVDRWGKYKLRNLLEASEKRFSIEELVESEMRVSLDQFEEKWLKYLKEKL